MTKDAYAAIAFADAMTGGEFSKQIFNMNKKHEKTKEICNTCCFNSKGNEDICRDAQKTTYLNEVKIKACSRYIEEKKK